MFFDDEEDYGSTRLRLAFKRKKDVQQHMNAETNLIQELLAIQTHTKKILKDKAMSDLGVRGRQLLGNRKKEVMKKHAPEILRNFVNEAVLEMLFKLFKCQGTIDRKAVEDTLRPMMTARFQIEALYDDDDGSTGKQPNQNSFEDAVTMYFALHTVQKENAAQQNKKGKPEKTDLTDLANFISNHPFFMDVIVMHLARNFYATQKETEDQAEGQKTNIRIIKRGYFATIFDEVKGIVDKPDLTDTDLFFLFMFNRIVSMCNAFFNGVKKNELQLTNGKLYICQTVEKDDVADVLKSIEEGKDSVFSTRINLFLNVLEHFMLEHYVTLSEALYNCKKVTIKKVNDRWQMGTEPRDSPLSA